MSKRMMRFIGTSILLLCNLWVFAQVKTITGTVVDADTQTPISGVSVQIKDTQSGVQTDQRGAFSIEVDPGRILTFSNVGYHPYEVRISNQTTLKVTLQASDQALDEVLVVAYGTSTKGTFTGSAEVVKSDAIKDNPNPSFEQALNGKVAGLQVTSSSGQAGAASTMRIRGIGSMNASNSPLFVVDGVPIISGNVGQISDYISGSGSNVLSTLNPNDIESITVLKDAAASSLYGSRAANGVVIITTKKGKLGKPKVDFKTSIALTPSWATDNWEIAGPQDQINTLYRILHDARTSGGDSDTDANQWVLNRFNTNFGKHGYEFSTGGTGLYENVNIKGRTDGVENRDGQFFDWEDALFQTGIYQTNDISISGATENTNYYSSLSYTKDKSRMIENEYDRYSGRINLTQKIGKYLEFGSNIHIAKTNTIGINDTRNLGTNYLFQTRNLLWPFYWPTDYKTGEEWTPRYGSLAYNALYFNKHRDNNAGIRKISAIESLNLTLLPELNIKTIFSYDETESKDMVYYGALHYSGSTDNGVVHEMSTNNTKLVSSTTANYQKTFNESHNLSALLGFEAEKNTSDFIRATGKNLPSSALPTVSTAGELDANAYSWGNSLLSVISRLEYNYQNKYFGSASFRRDGSSQLGPDVRWGNFWSVAGSWRLSEEAFLKDEAAVDDLKLRVSYGVNGTLPSSDYGWRFLMAYTHKYMEQPGAGISNIPDPNLTWETNYNTNVGLDFSFFSGKLFGSADYFNRNSENLLQNVPISTVTGFGSTLKNVGEINNKGFEFQIGSTLLEQGDWKWSASLNGAFLKSKVIKLYKDQGEDKGQDIIWNDPTGGDARTRYIYQEGQSTLAFYGIEWAGVDRETGKNLWYTNNPDVTADKQVDSRDATFDYTKASRIIIGDGNAKMYGGLSTDVQYKDFSLGLNFIYKVGGQLYDAASRDVADDGYYWERIRSAHFIENTWTEDNMDAELPRVSGQDWEDVNQVSSRHLYDASFLRLKNLTLAYQVPTGVLNKMGVAGARIYFNGTNLLTFSKYKNADPEVGNYSTRGWETPYGKVYTFGLEFSF